MITLRLFPNRSLFSGIEIHAIFNTKIHSLKECFDKWNELPPRLQIHQTFITEMQDFMDTEERNEEKFFRVVLI